MLDSNLRKVIGSRTEQRRIDLGLSQQEVADFLGVNKSTIQRYEKGTINNTKKMVLEGLSSALSVTPEWLRGETEDLESSIADNLDFQIQAEMKRIMDSFPLDLEKKETVFTKEILLILLKEYQQFNTSFTLANRKYAGKVDNSALSSFLEMNSSSEFNSMMFLREIMHTINTLTEVSTELRKYPENPKNAQDRIHSIQCSLKH